jgi:hypothetical protein
MSRLALIAALDAYVPDDLPGAVLVIASNPNAAILSTVYSRGTSNAAACHILAAALLAALQCDPAALPIPEHQKLFFPETKA